MCTDQINISDEERQKLLEGVDFSQLSEATLLHAHETEMVPMSYITKAALALCSKLRGDLEEAKRVIRQQDQDLDRFGLARRGSPWLRTMGDTGGLRVG